MRYKSKITNRWIGSGVHVVYLRRVFEMRIINPSKHRCVIYLFVVSKDFRVRKSTVRQMTRESSTHTFRIQNCLYLVVHPLISIEPAQYLYLEWCEREFWVAVFESLSWKFANTHPRFIVGIEDGAMETVLPRFLEFKHWLMKVQQLQRWLLSMSI